MKQIHFVILIGLLFTNLNLNAQSSFSGSLQANTKFFMRDSLRGAYGTPQYDNLLVGTDIWITANYNNMDWGLNAGIRLDVFNNSDLKDRLDAFSGVGIGRWFIIKKIKNLEITGGYFFDQIASGIIFRAYEERSLGIDNEIYGGQIKYHINPDWTIKLFTGQMKNQFSTYKPIIRGGEINGFVKVNKSLSLVPGFGFMNRTMDQASMDIVVSNIETMPVEDRFVPKYNVYALSLNNRLIYKNLSWYVEYAAKSEDPILNHDGKLVHSTGSVIYTTLDYSKKGFGITGQFKRTENFTLRTSPNETLLQGVINFLPPMARQNTYMLPSRYNAATQELAELAFQLDLNAKLSKKVDLLVNFSNITDLQNRLLYREFYTELTIKKGRDWKWILGGQYINYNQAVYEQKGDSLLTAITPFTEFTYRFNRKNSIRSDLQYMYNQEDYGSWVYLLVEYSIAPNWLFAVWDMYNIVPKKTEKALHYPAVFVTYRNGGNRFELGYVKQVEGIVCSGGVCRYEPAFSGFKLTINSTF
jgi:uncharacterized protein DUF6029